MLRRPFVPFSGSATSRHTRSSEVFITTTSGFKFSVHTGSRVALAVRAQQPERVGRIALFMNLPEEDGTCSDNQR